jgi:hypothetical protein
VIPVERVYTGIEGRLFELWDSRIDGITPTVKAYEQGYLDALSHTDQITDEHRELWERRLETCPGHDGHGGLNWCAYCGNLPPENEDEEEAQAGSEREGEG